MGPHAQRQLAGMVSQSMTCVLAMKNPPLQLKIPQTLLIAQTLLMMVLRLMVLLIPPQTPPMMVLRPMVLLIPPQVTASFLPILPSTLLTNEQTRSLYMRVLIADNSCLIDFEKRALFSYSFSCHSIRLYFARLKYSIRLFSILFKNKFRHLKKKKNFPPEKKKKKKKK